jgi:hypothetical protein
MTTLLVSIITFCIGFAVGGALAVWKDDHR